MYLVQMSRIACAMLLVLTAFPALAAPVPPCAGSVDPAYGAIGEQPNVAVWYAEDLKGWLAPACIGWQQSSADALRRAPRASASPA